MRITFICIIFIASLISGCASKKTITTEIVIGHDDPINELRKYSAEAVDELRLIAKARDYKRAEKMTAEQHAQAAARAMTVLPGFETQATINVSAPAHKVAEVIAKLSGYRYVEPKSIPADPVIVTIRRENVPLMELLKELGAKSGKRGLIEVFDTPEQVFKFTYKGM